MGKSPKQRVYMKIDSMNWDPYYYADRESIPGLWDDIVNDNQNIIYIMAKGFDPRMNSFPIELKDILKSNIKFHVLDIEGKDGPNKDLTDKNWNELEPILSSKNIEIDVEPVEMWKTQQNSKTRIGPTKVKEIVGNGLIDNYDTIVIDISSMPRAIYFSLISAILDLTRKENRKGNRVNVFINVVENPELDRKISSSGVDDKAEFIPQLGGHFEEKSSDFSLKAGISIPKIWIPILGEKQHPKLEKIHESVNPDEISPVIPFPSINPRRTDDLLIDYRELLFDRFRVEYENLIYASESNPFQLYRLLFRSITRYIDAFKSLGGCKIAISSLSSKLLSIGALLVSYDSYRIHDESVGLIHVGGSQYHIDSEYLKNYSKENEKLNTLWVDGTPYEQ